VPADVVVAALGRTCELLADLQVPAALADGLALAHWGHVRSTQDVDLLIAASAVRPQALLARLAGAGYRSKGKTPFVRLNDLEIVQLIYEPAGSLMPVQVVLLLAESPLHRSAVERRIRVPASALGFPIDIVTCEDLILLKLLAGRIVDRVDVAELLKHNRPSIDWAYVQDFTVKLTLERQFADAWNAALPGEPTPF
jgi:hypothetical protein